MIEIIRGRRNISLAGIGIEPEEPFVIVNGTQQLTAVPKPSSATLGSVTWSGGSSSSITVSATGLITGKSAEKRTSIIASAGNLSKWVYARCGYDVTAISFDDDDIIIEGIQGILFPVSVTPSGCTEISFAFASTDPTIANYYWVDGSGSSYEQQRRMWGYAVGEATVTAYGRSGNAQYPCRVVVTPVALQQLEIRALPLTNGTVVTEQGDTIPNVADYVYTMVGARAGVPVYFEPFNATQRRFTCSIDDDSIAEFEATGGANTYFNRQYGTARYETIAIHAKKEGTTTLTVTPEHGEGTSVEIRCLTQAQMRGTASWVARQTSGELPYGHFQLSMPHFSDSVNNISFVSTTDPNRDNSVYHTYNNGMSVWLQKAEGGKATTWAGYWAITMDDGSRVAISNTVSHYSPASE